jgi:hypothetical protein
LHRLLARRRDCYAELLRQLEAVSTGCVNDPLLGPEILRMRHRIAPDGVAVEPGGFWLRVVAPSEARTDPSLRQTIPES